MTIRFIMVRPATAGNVGAAARALKNMGFDGLWIVDPVRANVVTTHEARYMAHGAEDVLENARVVRHLDAALAGCRWIVGTSRRIGRQRVPPRTPRDFAAACRAAPDRRPLAVLFGPEEDGLGRAELARCHDIVRIPTARGQPSLNVAQAVMILAYELAAPAESHPRSAAHREAPAEEQEAMVEHLRVMLQEVGYLRPHSGHVRLLALRRILARARLSTDEVRLIRGICRKVLHAVRRPV